ncbi:TetR/AcrR family transcriptional regulator C-terminal domain-containing protein [Rhodococcus sp. G-MC3]|uniref:TetR/AcrR family transcriptional regulator C-terminal domain-containing protein n=1 Tax=Rhodococcus sp. G-MC3 TaxID=3046209 RepID=UPI0024B882B3|nr:TetR/AcrR family transcriptional regulator C-terminal domain-containing protein [Rhodococcus sp. G-MC3]MDJ0396698.1 TetR/AcrR family transcriptional regulator C-terminal domain-containing protein [Rhodococcus sp. G-MC3]
MPPEDPLDVWRRPERSNVGPKPEHSRAVIAAAAIEIADKDGLGAVSIRRVAASIGAGAASLYRYVRSRDELVDLMIDAVSGEYDLKQSSEPAPMQLLGLALQGRTIMHRHRWLAPLLLTRPSMGPSALRYLEHALAALESAQMSGPSKLRTVAMMTAITSAFVQNELASETSSGDTARDPNGSTRYLAEAVQSGRYPLLAAALTGQHEPDGPDDVFTTIIATYLEGAGLPGPPDPAECR